MDALIPPLIMDLQQRPFICAFGRWCECLHFYKPIASYDSLRKGGHGWNLLGWFLAPSYVDDYSFQLSGTGA